MAAKVASITGDKSTYIKKRAFDDGYYKKMVFAYIDQYKQIETIKKMRVSKILVHHRQNQNG
jgi:hypothetical protein